MVRATASACARGATHTKRVRGCARPRLRMPRSGRLAWPRCQPRPNEMREAAMAGPNWPLWEGFGRSRNGMAHRHVGSLHAADAVMALQNARDVYTRRGEGLSIWVVPSSAITASDPDDRDVLFEPTASKIYRHPT